jgi:hypothetical protein
MNTNDKDFKDNQEEIKIHHPQKECECELWNGQDVNTITNISKPIAKRIMGKSNFTSSSFKNNVNVMRNGQDMNNFAQIFLSQL